MKITALGIGLAVAIASCTSHSSPTSDAQIIERYRAAACIPFSRSQQVSPRTREWDTTLTLSDGSKVVVTGSDSLPGRIVNVRYPATGRVSIAANAVDYIYPTDIRIDAKKDLLSVRA